jgi:hypothetical protein
MSVDRVEIQAGYWPALALAEEAIEEARDEYRAGDALAAVCTLGFLVEDLAEAYDIASDAYDKASDAYERSES